MLRVRLIAAVALAASAVQPQVSQVDSRRGERVFETEGCIDCHSVAGRGANIAPDLGKTIARNYTPAALASTMWNHAPTMWSAIARRGASTSGLDEQAAADLFAYFYATRFFDRPGDAGRGKRLFAEKRCQQCHAAGAAMAENAPPVAQWESLASPIRLAEAMWNHSANMRQRFAQRGVPRPELTGQDLSDLLVYLRNLPPARRVEARLETGVGGDGRALFESKGCAGCHTGRLDLTPRLRGMNLTDIAADMWNHVQSMQPPPTLAPGEMRQIVSYLWSRQIFQEEGSATAGKKVFASKNCLVCHGDRSSGAPDLAARRGQFSSVSMMSALWRHGPRMLEQMKAKNLPWPQLTSRQMADLIVYLNSGS